jgi:hypothetical protein
MAGTVPLDFSRGGGHFRTALNRRSRDQVLTLTRPVAGPAPKFGREGHCHCISAAVKGFLYSRMPVGYTLIFDTQAPDQAAKPLLGHLPRPRTPAKLNSLVHDAPDEQSAIEEYKVPEH